MITVRGREEFDFVPNARCAGNGGDIIYIRLARRLRPSFRLAIIANDVVAERKKLVELGLEELRDKRSRKVENKHLFFFSAEEAHTAT